MRCLALFLLSALSVATLFEASELPLKVVSITPEAGQLYGTQPLTVVFSRPLVALGDDITTTPPFTVRAKQGEFAVPSKMRLVTTYIARLDPDVPWPPDLQLELLINRELKTFDGVGLAETPSPVSYSTSPLTMFLASVTSKRAKALTDGMWAPDSAFEIPPDGVAELAFGSEIEPARIQPCFSVTPAVPLTWAPCTSKQCLRFTAPSLAVGATYTLTLRAGCNYHQFAGPLTQDLNVSFSGLLPFRFPFIENSQLRFRRYQLWLRHGLAENVTISQLESAMSLTSGDSPVPFSLLDPRSQLGVLRLNAQFQPGRKYRLSFAASSSILDGFGLPLQAHSTEFSTAALPVEFVTLQDPFVVLEPPQVPWYHAALVQGTDNTARFENVYAVPPASLSRVMWFQQRGFGQCGETCGTKVGTLRSGATGFSIQRFPMSNNSALYLRERDSVPSSYPEFRFLSVTDLSLTALARSTSPTNVQVFVWVTRMSTGVPVEGVTVTVYGGGRASFEEEAAGVTGSDGVVELSFTPSAQFPSLSVSAVLRGEVAVLPNLGFYSTYYTPTSQLTGSFVTDLGIYRAEDPVRIKGYVRSLGRTRESWMLAPNVTLHVCFELRAADWATQTPEQWITTPVTLDATFGSFDAQFVLPADVKSGQQQVELRAYNDASLKTFTTIASTMILVADPRRPAAVLSVSTANEVYVPGELFLITVKTTTGSDIPISGANVTLLWSLSGGGSSNQRPSSLRFSSPILQQPTTQGTLNVITDGNGAGTATLRLPQAEVGDSLTLSGSWVGPTGELLKQDLPTLAVSDSPWMLDLSPSIRNPLPGFPFGVYLDLKTRQGVKLSGKTVTLRLRETGPKAISTGKTCTAVTNGAVNPSCNELSLSGMGKYEIVATVVDDAGRQLTSSIQLGNSQEEWDMQPLSSFDAMSLRLDKETYTVGDIAQISLQSPFYNATLLLRWTSNLSRVRPKNTFTTLSNPGRYSIPFPIGSECARSCQLIAVVSISRQTSFELPVQVPISHLWDPQQPRSIIQSLFINVPDMDREVSVKLSLSQPFVLPGDNVTGTVQVPLSSDDVEVAIFAVDRAYLMLQPHPLKNFSQDFTIQQAGSGFSATDNRQSLIPLKALVDTVSVFANRNAADPWIEPSWPAHPISWSTEVDVPDEQVFASHVSCITSFPNGCPANNYNWIGDKSIFWDSGISPSTIRVVNRDSKFARSFDMKEATGAPGVADGSSSSLVGPAVRTNMNPSPLFLRRLVIPANSSQISFDFTLPDDIGTFVVRAYVATANSHRFGAAEASVVARRSISLEARLPRLVRIGDNFTAGVIVESVSSSPQNITVNASSFSNALTLDSDFVVVQSKQGPVAASFGMRAVALDTSSPLKFVASVSSAPVDALQVPLRVLGTQSDVFVATSMALHSQTKGPWTWTEGLHLPATAPGSGTLNMTLGVGRLPVIKAIAELLKQAPLTGEVAIAQAAIKAAYTKYPVVQPTEMFEAAKKQLATFSSVLGLRYSKDYDAGRADAHLNALALQLALFLQLSNNTLAPELTGRWKEALKQELIRRAEDSKRFNANRPFEEWQLLADAFFGLGPQVEEMHPDLALSRLLAAIPSCSLSTKLSLALAFLLRSLPLPSQLAHLNQDLLNVMRVQGRFVYVSESRSVASAATGSTQAMALLFMARQEGNSPLIVEKLANWVAGGNGNSAGCGYSFGSGMMSLTAIALADYDTLRGNNKPDLQVLVKNGGVLLLSGEFNSAETTVKSTTLTWEDLNAPNDPIVFTGKGIGEVSVALGLDFIPRTISVDPVFRGLFVEKVIRRLDAKGEATGGGLQLVESGALVQVCVQVTSPDDVRSLVIEDLSCGGLEPLESSPSSTIILPSFGGWWRWFDPLANSRQVRSDRVTWNSAYVYAGSNSVCYNAVANIPGVYSLPPAKAFSSPEPELMGLSAGGTFVVSAAPVADVSAELRRLNVAPVERLTPKSCGECSSPYQYCNVRMGTCAYYEVYAGGKAPEWQPSLLASPGQMASPLLVLCFFGTLLLV